MQFKGRANNRAKNRVLGGGVAIAMSMTLIACSSVPRLPLLGGGQKTDTEETSEVSGPATVSQSEDQITIPPAAPEAVIPKFIASDLLGLSSPQLDGLLGEAAFTNRPGGEGQLRRYDQPNCNLLVIMRRDVSGRLLSSDLRPSKKRSSQPAPDLQTCLNGF